MKNIIIMYHYVRDDPDFKAFSTDEFRKQVEYLKSRYQIVTLRELLEEKPKENTCVLTFDDGIKDCVTNAMPIMEELGVRGTFFIPTIILKEKKLTQVQKRHLLLAKIGTAKFVDEFNACAEDVFKIRHETLSYCYDDPLTSNLKITLDTMDWHRSQEILQDIFNMYFDEEDMFDLMHLTIKDISKMENAGMEIGTHGHSHRPLGNLYFQDMEKDLAKTMEVFQETFGKYPTTMSYPFGSFNMFTKRIAQKLGYLAAITTIKKPNTHLDNIFELHRYDCNDAFPRTNKYDI